MTKEAALVLYGSNITIKPGAHYKINTQKHYTQYALIMDINTSV
jgi:hypothetical protein